MKNRTKAKLAAGETVFGAMVNLPSPAVVESLAFAQLDFAILNTEHAAIDIATVAEMVRAAEAAGIDALLRIGSSDGIGIARCLDLGVAGVQAPSAGAGARAGAARPDGQVSPAGNAPALADEGLGLRG
jgi:2-keto-3-deoxy-L-rhamnonate aldolase RhmA